MEGRARLAYPLTDRRDRVVAIEGRALLDVKPKSLCDGPKGAGVFAPAGLNLDDLHLCEGAFDAACLAGLGLSAVVICGTAIPDWLLRTVSFRHLWAAFDADVSGDKAADTAAQALAKRGSVVRRLRPPLEGTDWGNYLLEPKTVRLNAYWEDQGIALCVRLLRADFDRLLRQIEYLHRHSAKAINDWQTRWATRCRQIRRFCGKL